MSLKFWKCLKRYFSSSSSKLRKHGHHSHGHPGHSHGGGSSSKGNKGGSPPSGGLGAPKSPGGGPHNLKGKSTSSQKWITRQLKDPYVKRAREESYRCRSAFKLVEIDDRFDLLRPGSVVIDCGAAPGSWTQVAVERVNAAGTAKSQKEGCVISIDKQFMVPVKGAITLATMDFTKGQTQNKVLEVLSGRQADIILSDMAPNTTGIRSMDHDIIIELCFSVLEFSRTVLRPDGALLCKLWQGHEQKTLEQRLGNVFQTVKIIKPQASRGDSAEIFLLGKGYTPTRTHIH